MPAEFCTTTKPTERCRCRSIITKSSNIGAAKIGIERLGDKSLYDYAWNYGFGQRTGIPLPGEARGFLYPVTKWSKVSIAQIPMGHGVAVTRLQMLDAMAAIANGGVSDASDDREPLAGTRRRRGATLCAGARPPGHRPKPRTKR